MTPNEWLTSPETVLKFSELPYPEQFYVDYFKKVSTFVKKCPAHLLCTWDGKSKNRIWIQVGKDYKEYLLIDQDISFFDSLTMLERTLKKCYPYGEILKTVEEDYTEEEIIELIKNKKLDNPEDAFNLKKKFNQKDWVMIDRIQLLEDTFRIVHSKDGIEESFIRVSKIPISQFLKHVRSIKDSAERYAYIFDKSHQLNEVKYATLELTYSGKMLLNFININKSSIKDSIQELRQDANGDVVYKWGRFLFKLTKNDVVYNEIITNINNLMQGK